MAIDAVHAFAKGLIVRVQIGRRNQSFGPLFGSVSALTLEIVLGIRLHRDVREVVIVDPDILGCPWVGLVAVETLGGCGHDGGVVRGNEGIRICLKARLDGSELPEKLPWCSLERILIERVDLFAEWQLNHIRHLGHSMNLGGVLVVLATDA